MATQDEHPTPQQSNPIDDELIRGVEDNDDLSEGTDDEFDEDELEDEDDEEEGAL